MFRRVDRAGWTRVKNPRRNHHAQAAANLVVKERHRIFARADAVQKWLGQKKFTVSRWLLRPDDGAHLHVQSAAHRLGSAVGAAPVRHHKTGKLPFAFEQAVDEIVVVGAMFAAKFRVGAHHGPDVRLLDGGLERRQINFAQRAFVKVHVDGLASTFLVVADEMFDARGHAIRLQSLDIIHSHPGVQVGILAEVFVNPPAQRRPRDVHDRRQHHVLVARPRLAADHVAVSCGQIRVPSGTQGAQHRQPGGVIVGAADRIPRIRPDVLAHAVRAVIHPAAGNAQTRHGCGGKFGIGVDDGNFFLQRHPRKQIVHARLDGLLGIEIERLVLRTGNRNRWPCQRKTDRAGP